MLHLDLIMNKNIRGIENEHVLKPYIPPPYLKETNKYFVTILGDRRGLTAVLLLSLKSMHREENSKNIKHCY